MSDVTSFLAGSDLKEILIETVGFLAAATTVAAFYCRRMLLLRVAAIAANLLFIAYGFALDLRPVLYLHCILLPLNAARLAGCLRERAASLRAKADATVV